MSNYTVDPLLSEAQSSWSLELYLASGGYCETEGYI